MAENETIRQAGGDSEGAYRAFLLRCWQEEAGGGAPWRFTLATSWQASRCPAVPSSKHGC